MELPAQEAAKIIKDGKVKVVDVREDDEYEYGHLPSAIHFPMSSFSDEILNIVSKDNKVLVICRGGVRSFECTKKLKEFGYKDVCSVVGGLKALNEFLDEKISVKQ